MYHPHHQTQATSASQGANVWTSLDAQWGCISEPRQLPTPRPTPSPVPVQYGAVAFPPSPVSPSPVSPSRGGSFHLPYPYPSNVYRDPPPHATAHSVGPARTPKLSRARPSASASSSAQARQPRLPSNMERITELPPHSHGDYIPLEFYMQDFPEVGIKVSDLIGYGTTPTFVGVRGERTYKMKEVPFKWSGDARLGSNAQSVSDIKLSVEIACNSYRGELCRLPVKDRDLESVAMYLASALQKKKIDTRNLSILRLEHVAKSVWRLELARTTRTLMEVDLS